MLYLPSETSNVGHNMLCNGTRRTALRNNESEFATSPLCYNKRTYVWYKQ